MEFHWSVFQIVGCSQQSCIDSEWWNHKIFMSTYYITNHNYNYVANQPLQSLYTWTMAFIKGCALAIPSIQGREGGGTSCLIQITKNFMRFSSRPVYICIVQSQNAIPTIFEPVGNNLKGFMASALPLAALCQRQLSASHTGCGQSKQMASCMLNTCCAHLPARFSLYRAFPPLMIDIRLKNASKQPNRRILAR